jgi:hypothetical protein
MSSTFIPVTGVNITSSQIAFVNEPLELTGTVVPNDATKQTIKWKVAANDAAKADIIGNTLYPKAKGTVMLHAIVEGGASE